MGKTRPPERTKLARHQKKKVAEHKRHKQSFHTSEELLAQAVVLLQQSDAETALQCATSALSSLKENLKTEEDLVRFLPVLSLLGVINIELGDVDTARKYFHQAAKIDEDGDIPENQGGGADKFMWLAQLSEEGGADSVRWFEKGAGVLRKQIEALQDPDQMNGSLKEAIVEKKTQLATVLCGIAEVYMTDLSWDEKAEQICNEVVEQALTISPENPQTLQTIASVRISQSRQDEAQEFLKQSLYLWQKLPPGSPDVPDFPVRISLARLLLEAEMEERAIEVLERLAHEDDRSLETWYLGGLSLYLLTERKIKTANGDQSQSAEYQELRRRARRWLLRCLSLYESLDYEDERLKKHANELVESLGVALGDTEDEDLELYSAAEEDWEDDDNDNNDDNDEDDAVEEDKSDKRVWDLQDHDAKMGGV